MDPAHWCSLGGFAQAISLPLVVPAAIEALGRARCLVKGMAGVLVRA